MFHSNYFVAEFTTTHTHKIIPFKMDLLPAFLASLVLITSASSSPFIKIAEDPPHNKRASKSNQDEYVPVHPIPGTDLFTGIYYKVGLNRFPNGWLTWTEEKSQQGYNYVQIDGNSKHTANYEKSGDWYNDIQWFFVPSEDEQGWYTLRNRQLPEAIATWNKSDIVDDLITSFRLNLNRKANPTHPDSLWKPIAQWEHTNGRFFQLRSKSFPEAIVTWTWKESGDTGSQSHYMQLDVSEDPSRVDLYKPNNGWYVDTLFTFDNLDRELIGEITQLEMQLFPKLDEIRGLTVTDCDSVLSTIFINVDSYPFIRQIKQDIVNQGELTLKLHEPLSQFSLMKIRSSTGQISPPWYADAVLFQTGKHEYSYNEDIKLITSEHGRVNTNVIIPALSSTEVRVCREFIDTSDVDVDIDVSVFMEVYEESYRPSNSRKKFEAVFTKLPATEFAYPSIETLANITHTFDIDERWGLVSASLAGNSQLKAELEDSGIKILGSRESEVMIIARGTVKGRFGYRGVVASN